MWDGQTFVKRMKELATKRQQTVHSQLNFDSVNKAATDSVVGCNSSCVSQPEVTPCSL